MNSYLGMAVGIAMAAFLSAVPGFGEKIGEPPALPRIAVLNPVDLAMEGEGPRLWGDLVRRNLAQSGKWEVIPVDSVVEKYRAYGLEPDNLCREFQCAYDAGTVIGSSFVLFGTVTALQEFYTYTLNLVHLPTVQTVWSRVGEVVRRREGNPAQGVQTVLGDLVGQLDPMELSLESKGKRGLMTVIDLNPASVYSRVMAERTTTHLYGSREFNVMTQQELNELLLAMEIDRTALPNSDESILNLGRKADVSHMVASRLTLDNQMYRLQMQFFDVTEGKKLRDWPSPATSDFQKILQFEKKFFAGLFKNQDDIWQPAKERPGKTRWWPTVVSGMLVTAGAVMGYLAYDAHKGGEAEYQAFLSAQSRETAVHHRAQVEGLDRKRNWLGLSGGASAGLGLALFVF